MTLSGWERTATAYHEAGHAVVAWLIGYNVISVRLFNGDGGQFGGMKLGRPSNWLYTHLSERKQHCPDIALATLIVIKFAGLLAERRLDPKQFDVVYPRERAVVTSDISEILDLLSRMDLRDAVAREKQSRVLMQVAANLLDGYWCHVAALANALLANGRIVRKQGICELMGRRPVSRETVIADVAGAMLNL